MKVKFLPQDKEIEIRPNESVLHLAQQNDIHIQSVCKGIPSCAECRVKIVEGEHNVLPPSDKELNLIGTAYFVDRSRLSCQLKCFGDITVDLSEQEKKQDSTTKRPRGRLRGDENEDEQIRTRAVMGNIIFSDDEVESMMDEEALDKGTPPDLKSEPVAPKSTFYDVKSEGQPKSKNSKNNKGSKSNKQDGQKRSRRSRGHRRNKPAKKT